MDDKGRSVTYSRSRSTRSTNVTVFTGGTLKTYIKPVKNHRTTPTCNEKHDTGVYYVQNKGLFLKSKAGYVQQSQWVQRRLSRQVCHPHPTGERGNGQTFKGVFWDLLMAKNHISEHQTSNTHILCRGFFFTK